MAAPQTFTQLPDSQVEAADHPLFAGFDEPPLMPPFLPSTIAENGENNGGQNHDRHINNTGILPPPPPLPPGVDITDVLNPLHAQDGQQVVAGSTTQEAQNQMPGHERRASEDGDGSPSENSESEDEDDDQPSGFPWQPVHEDKTTPCDDELTYIASRGEHSAHDQEYWHRKTFFDIGDPDIIPLDHGSIDWTVEHFNGTKEEPNTEFIMRSPIVRIGGYDWRIKFYPKGNNTDYLSAYLECVTMQADDFEESKDFEWPPLPFLKGEKKQKQRRTVAAQVSIVMYNPAEPRVYEYQRDAHQFSKSSSDYGWTRFTRHCRRDFPFRTHGQRRALLQNDTLAFKAHIRVVNDPTGCLWSHGTKPYDDSVAMTGLRPFSTMTPMFSAMLPLLHFGPFRNFIQRCQDTRTVWWFHQLLQKMMKRKCSEYYGGPMACQMSDPTAWLRHLAMQLRKESDAKIVNDLIGSLDADAGGAISRNRLKTKNFQAVQAAVNAHPTTLETPALLILELERHEFDRTGRKWNKLTNKVDMEDSIVVNGQRYVLYSFATHCGELQSNRFNVYIRPSGPATLWYQYKDGNVTCMTQKQALEKRCGIDPNEVLKPSRHASRHDHSLRGFSDLSEVAQTVMYVRDDCASILAAASNDESWDIPDSVLAGLPPKEVQDLPEPPPTAARLNDAEPNSVALEAERVADQAALEEERERKNSFVGDPGYATPGSWDGMDGNDVVMSDAEDDSETTITRDIVASAAGLGCFSGNVTIDQLGLPYYQGQYVDRFYHGDGHLIAMNGDEYHGAFRDGEKHGRGKMLYAATGNTYEGDWENGQHHGQGKLVEKSTGNLYEGGFKDGKKHGHFNLSGTVTDEDKNCCSICYDKDLSTAFYDCGHVVACRDCAYKIDTCPVCRKRVLARLDIWGVKMAFE